MSPTESRPCVPLGLAPSFGFGDRTGRATPGHVAALQASGRKAGIEPIFPQQSIREMARTGRNPDGVMADALAGMRAGGWSGRTGADADHLKTPADVDITAAAGFTFFTIDPSDHVDPHADDRTEADLRDRFDALANAGELGWVEAYRGRRVDLGGTIIDLTDEALTRAAVKYGRAIDHAIALARHIAAVHRQLGREDGYEIELSVDETEQPTTPAEHYLIADRLRSAEIRLISLAPRFPGAMEKGVDYKGDLALLARSLADHAAIAAALGPYKLSLHSGSDKLAMYPALARATRGRFHVKTAGTSYLEALRVVARHDPSLFARIVTFARSRYEADRATYHVSATLESAPPTGTALDLERHYLGLWSETAPGVGFTQPGRQILHCTFGSTLTDPTLGPALLASLDDHPDTYAEVLEAHFTRHLDALSLGL